MAEVIDKDTYSFMGAGAATCGDRVRGRRGKEREGNSDLRRC